LIDRLGVRSDARVGTMSAGEIRRGEAYLLIKSSLGRNHADPGVELVSP
jgi:hypothetical protein